MNLEAVAGERMWKGFVRGRDDHEPGILNGADSVASDGARPTVPEELEQILHEGARRRRNESVCDRGATQGGPPKNG